mmetsp:Transcript_24325/g.79378  ORF Transcript_24325/g.79378 Transcript_24325/m.79378 type:complete len:219 (-) Transcript_24325:279-935(-)
MVLAGSRPILSTSIRRRRWPPPRIGGGCGCGGAGLWWRLRLRRLRLRERRRRSRERDRERDLRRRSRDRLRRSRERLRLRRSRERLRLRRSRLRERLRLSLRWGGSRSSFSSRSLPEGSPEPSRCSRSCLPRPRAPKVGSSPRPSSFTPWRCGARCPRLTLSAALTEGGRRTVLVCSARREPPWPPHPSGLAENPSLTKRSLSARFTISGMRGRMVSK